MKSQERLSFHNPNGTSKRPRALVQEKRYVEERSYHWTLRSRSLTVRVTWAIVGIPGMEASS